MATFRPVNATSREPDLHGRNREEKDSNTSTNSNMQASSLVKEPTAPTTIMFATLATQKPLPASTSFPPSAPTTVPKEDPTTVLHRGGSQRSAVSTDVDMDVSEDNDDGDGEQAGSEEDVVNTDGTISKKPKGGGAAAAAPGGKSQRFFCSDYPPCNLSFTRSEHLARHIRKHTGERPFQCHCNRRFSRLDNLRQHAQTVHQNEDIPQDSLAATGTRFQRQVRTERVRPPGNRSRGNTVGSQTGTIRGHHRNSLSTSSIGSVTSVYSNSGHGIAERRRPPPLVMANGERARYTQEILGRPESPLGPDRTTSQSSGGFTTPPSTASYSTHHHISPRWSSAMQSPITPHAPRPSPYTDHRPPARRLSVPSVGVGDPLPLPQPNTFGTPPLGPRSIAAVASAAAATPPLPCFSPSTPSSSVIASPTTPNMGSTFSRPDLIPIALDEDFRRRTWHPETYSNLSASSAFTSRLQRVPNYYALGTPPQPPIVPSNALPLHQMRLPGIESFDPPRTAPTPPRREPSPMLIDTPTRAAAQPVESFRRERLDIPHWEYGINRNMNRLDLHGPDPPNSWPSDATRAGQAPGELRGARGQGGLPANRFEEHSYAAHHLHHASAPVITPRENKRMGWYNGPVTGHKQGSQPFQHTSEGGIPRTLTHNIPNHGSKPGVVYEHEYTEDNRDCVVSSLPSDSRTTHASSVSRMEDDITYTHSPARQPALNQQNHQTTKTTDDASTMRLQALVQVAIATRDCQDHVATAY